MSIYRNFKRAPVQQGALQSAPTVIPAPIKGIVEIENWAYTAPGSAQIMDNWFPTQRGIKLRGGTERWTKLPNKETQVGNPPNAFTISHAAEEGGWAAKKNLRQFINSAAISISGPAFRISVGGPTTDVDGTFIEEVFAGHCDDNGNFIGAPVRVTFQSATSIHLDTAEVRYSDPIPYEVDAAQHFAIAMYIPDADADTVGGHNAITNGVVLWKDGPSEVDTVNITGYASIPTSARVVLSMDVYSTLEPPYTEPILSGMEYVSGNIHKMFVSTPTRVFDVSMPDYSIHQFATTNGHYSSAQFANQGGDYLLAVNDTGDYVRRFNGTSWVYLDAPGTTSLWANGASYAVNDVRRDAELQTLWKCLFAHTSPGTGTFAAARTANPTYWTPATASDGSSYITGPLGVTGIVNGAGLTYVWKYRNRLYFIQGGTMSAWYLPLNSVGGVLQEIPLSGAAKRGGSLLFGCSWAVDGGDGGVDDKNCFFTTEGEVLIFSGSDPGSINNWKQDGRFDISKPLGKNGHTQLGGDVLVVTIDGVVPLSAAMSKAVEQLSLSAVSRNIERTWMAELRRKDAHPWSITKWDEGDALYVNFPGGTIGKPETLTVGVGNLHTGAWARFTNHDAMCFMHYRGGLFFGTQDSRVMQCDSGGMDDGRWDVSTGKFEGQPYVCTMVGGWEMFKAPPNQVTWFQARAAFFSSAREPFEPQLAATTDYEFRIPSPPNAGPDPDPSDVWDEGLWDVMLWDAAPPPPAPVKNTMWVSIGETGFSHAPICQVTVAQQVKPNVELLSISATFVRMGVNV